MAESSAAADISSSASVKSLLDKPLHLLTEDDIAQVTREDCRRYLKDKGMRRPSWNKSQAIQQVIMLKGLLETTPPDCDSRKRLRINVSNDELVTESVPKRTVCETKDYISEGLLNRGKDLERPNFVAVDTESAQIRNSQVTHFVAADSESAKIRNLGSTSVVPVGQMAIFYSGNVNVYEDIPADKAQEILRVAASPLNFSQEHRIDGTMSLQQVSRVSNAVSTREHPDHAVQWPHFQPAKKSDNPRVCGEENFMLREETPRKVECTSTREASVQRYLEKKKDRFKSIRK